MSKVPVQADRQRIRASVDSVIAMIPYQAGYHPSDGSVVVLGLSATDEIGPLAVMDASVAPVRPSEDLEQSEDLMKGLAGSLAKTGFDRAVVVGYGAAGESAAAWCAQNLAGAGFTVMSVTGVRNGYWRALGDARSQYELIGDAPAVVVSNALDAFGGPPARSREELVARYARAQDVITDEELLLWDLNSVVGYTHDEAVDDLHRVGRAVENGEPPPRQPAARASSYMGAVPGGRDAVIQRLLGVDEDRTAERGLFYTATVAHPGDLDHVAAAAACVGWLQQRLPAAAVRQLADLAGDESNLAMLVKTGLDSAMPPSVLSAVKADLARKGLQPHQGPSVRDLSGPAGPSGPNGL